MGTGEGGSSIWSCLLGQLLPLAPHDLLHADKCPETCPEGPSAFSALLPSRAPPLGGGEAVEREASKSKRSPFTHCDLLTLLLELSSHHSVFKGAADLPEIRQEKVGSWLGGFHSYRLLFGVPLGALDIVYPPKWSAPQRIADVTSLCKCIRHMQTSLPVGTCQQRNHPSKGSSARPAAQLPPQVGVHMAGQWLGCKGSF